MPPDAARSASEALREAGLAPLTELVHVFRPQREPRTPRWPPGLRVRTAEEAGYDVFVEALAAAQRTSQDLPELQVLVAPAAQIEGMRREPGHAPGWWFTLDSADQNVAIVMLDRLDEDAAHFTFLGVAPEARRRGLGLAVLEAALAEVGPQEVVGIVDARNGNMLRLLGRAGFRVTRTDFLWIRAPIRG